MSEVAIVEVAPGAVTITRPAWLVAQFMLAEAERERLYGKPILSDAEEVLLDATEAMQDSASTALRQMVAGWGCDPDQFAKALR